jgi:hypothetical protein
VAVSSPAGAGADGHDLEGAPAAWTATTWRVLPARAMSHPISEGKPDASHMCARI